MFCTKCGRELPNNAKFCSHCGAPQGSESVNRPAQQRPVQQPYTQQSYSPPQPTAKPKKKSKTAGIIMLVIGLISVYGGFANGSYAQMAAYGIDLANIVTLLIQAGLIVGGIMKISKSKEN